MRLVTVALGLEGRQDGAAMIELLLAGAEHDPAFAYALDAELHRQGV